MSYIYIYTYNITYDIYTIFAPCVPDIFIFYNQTLVHQSLTARFHSHLAGDDEPLKDSSTVRKTQSAMNIKELVVKLNTETFFDHELLMTIDLFHIFQIFLRKN